jgi:hypothetical protein
VIIYNHIFAGEKILNFIDRRGFVLSFECNNVRNNVAGWFLSEDSTQESLIRQPSLKNVNRELRRWRFDPSWYDEVEYLEAEDIDWDSEDDANILDNGTMAIFRIINDDDRYYHEKYIHIYNCHDGYNSRHFDFSDKRDEVIESGDL